MSTVEDILVGFGAEDSVSSVTNLDTVTTLVFERNDDLNEANPQPENSALEQDATDDDAKPKKKLRYDKLGRLVEVETVSHSFGPTLANVSNNGTLRRPRGRPPKGKLN